MSMAVVRGQHPSRNDSQTRVGSTNNLVFDRLQILTSLKLRKEVFLSLGCISPGFLAELH